MIKCINCGETYNRDENAAKNIANYKPKQVGVPMSGGELTVFNHEDSKTQ